MLVFTLVALEKMVADMFTENLKRIKIIKMQKLVKVC